MEALRDLAFFLRHVRRGGKRGIIVCPKCGSDRIRRDRESVGFSFLPQVYICGSCQYRGSIVLEIEKGKEQPEPAT